MRDYEIEVETGLLMDLRYPVTVVNHGQIIHYQSKAYGDELGDNDIFEDKKSADFGAFLN